MTVRQFEIGKFYEFIETVTPTLRGIRVRCYETEALSVEETGPNYVHIHSNTPFMVVYAKRIETKGYNGWSIQVLCDSLGWIRYADNSWCSDNIRKVTK